MCTRSDFFRDFFRARGPLAVCLSLLASDSLAVHAGDQKQSAVVRGQSDGLWIHEPRFGSTTKVWHEYFCWKPTASNYGKGFGNWTRFHQYRLPVVPPLYEAEFGYRAPNWRQLPASTSYRNLGIPGFEVAPPAQWNSPAPTAESIPPLETAPPMEELKSPTDVPVPPAPPASIELQSFPGGSALPTLPPSSIPQAPPAELGADPSSIPSPAQSGESRSQVTPAADPRFSAPRPLSLASQTERSSARSKRGWLAK